MSLCPRSIRVDVILQTSRVPSFDGVISSLHPHTHTYPSRPIISGQFWQKDITTTLNHNELLLSAISVQRMERCQIPASFVTGRSGNSSTIYDHGFTNCRTTTTNNNNNNNNNNYYYYSYYYTYNNNNYYYYSIKCVFINVKG